MATIKAKELKLKEANPLLKGVKSSTPFNDEGNPDQFMASQISISRKSGKGNKDKIMEFLSVPMKL